MSGSYAVQMGDRGRFVVPKELRDRIWLSEGTPLLLLESEEGIVVMTRAQALRRFRGSSSEPRSWRSSWKTGAGRQLKRSVNLFDASALVCFV